MRLSREEFNALIAKRPHLAPVGALAPSKREQGSGKALDQKPRRFKGSKGSVVVVVTIISCRRGELDSDNLVAGCKPIRDAIARSLGIDDADPRVRWEYGQCQTNGEQGCIVKLERIDL